MKTFRIALFSMTACCLLTSPLDAQEAPAAEPTKEHLWLKKFEGNWTSKAEAFDADGNVVLQSQGSMSSRMLGNLWVISNITGDMGVAKIEAVQTIGYDTEKKQYVGTWVDSFANFMWKYTGSVDETGRTLHLEATGPNYVQSGATATFRDSYEFKSKDLIEATSAMMGEDGKWVVFMKGEFRRDE